MTCNGSYRTVTSRRAYPASKIKFIHPLFQNQFEETTAMIDSGSSGTLIPSNIAQKLGLLPSNVATMIDYQGNVTGNRNVYVVLIKICDMEFTSNVAETDGEAIIGRDILNQLTATLKGKQQKWELV